MPLDALMMSHGRDDNDDESAAAAVDTVSRTTCLGCSTAAAAHAASRCTTSGEQDETRCKDSDCTSRHPTTHASNHDTLQAFLIKTTSSS